MNFESNLVYSFFISDYCELIFQKTEIKGNSYADIRQFLHSSKYTGPTPKGLIMKRDVLEALINGLQNNKEMIRNSKVEKEITKVSYKNSSYIVISLKESTIDNYPFCIDIREYLVTEKYEGFTKKGFRISVNQLDDFLVGCKQLLKVL